jgi:hypothetical protein
MLQCYQVAESPFNVHDSSAKKHITDFRIYFLLSPKEKEHRVTLNVSNVSV